MPSNTTTAPEEGKTYIVRHARKGMFTAKVCALNDEWADLEVVAGRADAMCAYNVAEKGETVTVRLSQCSFTPAGEAV